MSSEKHLEEMEAAALISAELKKHHAGETYHGDIMVCATCIHKIRSTREAERALALLRRPTSDSCWEIKGLHVHPMNRITFTCRHWRPGSIPG